MATSSRKRSEPDHAQSVSQHLIYEANDLSRDDFQARYVASVFASVEIDIHFHDASSAKAAHQFYACLDLVEETSKATYQASTVGWSRAAKEREMSDRDMKFLIHIEEQDASRIGAFLAFMITEEEYTPVVYCYEVHVSPDFQRRGIGLTLMRCMDSIGKAVGVTRAMLTVFTSNESARRFYERQGYQWYDEEPVPAPKRLRSRNTGRREPAYVILAKDLK